MSPARALLWLTCAFSSAFLLFVAQPMLAKWLLPSFGGSPGTWAACMLFFQSLLLVGYAYAWLLSRSAPRLAFVVHAGLALGVVVFAGVADPLDAPQPLALSPGFSIPWLLLRRVGLPYLLVATTAPLLQAWAAQLGAAVPHRLYAVSNAGSLLSLLAYPWLIEGQLVLAMQYRAWLIGTAVFACAVMACAALAASSGRYTPQPWAATRFATGCYWLCCAFVPSLFLLAATDALTVDLAATPALWILPLALYLLSFIIAFAGMAQRLRTLLLVAWVIASLGLGYIGFAEGSAGTGVQLTFVLGGLALACLLCHDALVQARPEPAQLPVFYLWTAAGGALGGVYVSVLAPRLFDDYYELELACVLTYGVLGWAAMRTAAVFAADRRWLYLGLGIALPLMAAAVITRAGPGSAKAQVLERRRSWFGALRVTQLEVGRMLTHGRIRHGMQLSDPARATWPTMYFGPGTAVAQVLARHGAGQPRSIGVVGLGIGTLAAYGGAQDHMSFYELDPNVLEVAQRSFSFLADSKAQLRFVVGDGRLALANEPSERFDVLVLDAFASDAVPAHLLTQEAFLLYEQRLAPDGVLLANVSNRHLAVDRVVRAAGQAAGLSCTVVETPANVERFVSKVRWAVLAHSWEQLDRELEGLTPAARSGSDVLWTDTRASIWSILK